MRKMGGANAPPNAYKAQKVMYLYCLNCNCKKYYKVRYENERCKCGQPLIAVTRRMKGVAEALTAIGIDVREASEWVYYSFFDSEGDGACLALLCVEMVGLQNEALFFEFPCYQLSSYWEFTKCEDSGQQYSRLTFNFNFPVRQKDARVLSAVKAISKCAICDLQEWAESLKVSGADAVMVLAGLLP